MSRDFSFDIAESMEEALLHGTLKKTAEPLVKVAEVADHLNKAAEMLDSLGLTSEAEAITTVLEVIAKKKDKKKLKKKTKKLKSDPATKNLKPEKMVENLKEKGWVFNDDDGHGESCDCSMCMDGDVNSADDSDTEHDSDYYRVKGDELYDVAKKLDNQNKQELAQSYYAKSMQYWNYADKLDGAESDEYFGNLNLPVSPRGDLNAADEPEYNVKLDFEDELDDYEPTQISPYSHFEPKKKHPRPEDLVEDSFYDDELRARILDELVRSR